jgi:hypothetical protein
MAHKVSLVFTKTQPTQDKLNTLNEGLLAIDSDIPKLALNGWDKVIWHGTSINLQHLANLLHHIGFPCEITSYMLLGFNESVELGNPITSSNDISEIDKFVYQSFMSVWHKRASCKDQLVFQYVSY